MVHANASHARAWSHSLHSQPSTTTTAVGAAIGATAALCGQRIRATALLIATLPKISVRGMHLPESLILPLELQSSQRSSARTVGW